MGQSGSYLYDGTLEIENRYKESVKVSLYKLDFSIDPTSEDAKILFNMKHRCVKKDVVLSTKKTIRLEFEERAEDIDKNKDFPLRDILDSYVVVVKFEDLTESYYTPTHGYDGGFMLEGMRVTEKKRLTNAGDPN